MIVARWSEAGVVHGEVAVEVVSSRRRTCRGGPCRRRRGTSPRREQGHLVEVAPLVVVAAHPSRGRRRCGGRWARAAGRDRGARRADRTGLRARARRPALRRRVPPARPCAGLLAGSSSVPTSPRQHGRRRERRRRREPAREAGVTRTAIASGRPEPGHPRRPAQRPCVEPFIMTRANGQVDEEQEQVHGVDPKMLTGWSSAGGQTTSRRGAEGRRRHVRTVLPGSPAPPR